MMLHKILKVHRQLFADIATTKETLEVVNAMLEMQKQQLHSALTALHDIQLQINALESSRNESLRSLKDELEAMRYWPNQNLKKRLFDVAGTSTAQFIIENMRTVPSFSTSRELLSHSLSNVSLEEGLYAEFGVYSGNSINYIARLINSNIIYGFDSFQGLPETWRTGFEKGTFKLEELPRMEPNVCLIKGYFDDTLPGFIKSHSQKFAFIHVDCDLYSSTKSIFKYLAPQITPGCIIVFDEFFNYPGWENGEFKAFKEFITAEKKEFEFIGYVETHEQAAVIIR